MNRLIINSPRSIGASLRRLRQSREQTTALIAASAGLSKSYISMLESGDRSTHWSVLMRIDHALGETLCSFLTKAGEIRMPEGGVRTRRQDVILLEGDEGDAAGTFVPDATRCTRIVTPYHPGMTSEVVEVALPPHSQWTPDPVVFPAGVCSYTISGKALLVLVGKTEYTAAEGECLLYDASQPHLLRNYTNSPARLLLTINPATF